MASWCRQLPGEVRVASTPCLTGELKFINGVYELQGCQKLSVMFTLWGLSDVPAGVHGLPLVDKIARVLATACVRPLLPRDARSDCAALVLRPLEGTPVSASFQSEVLWQSSKHRVGRSSFATRRSFEDARR